jgi:hypothetical protein
MPKTLYLRKDFHGGGKATSLVCFKEKIVIPGQRQKHVINWYHTTLCHPGINRTEETIGQHLWWPRTTPLVAKNASTHNQLCTNLPSMSKKQEEKKEVWITPTKVS